MHDGTARIVVEDGTAEEQFDRLWELLVPSSGAAATIQGEVVRIAGRVTDEILRNGGANWDKDYRSMVSFWCSTVGTSPEAPELAALADSLRSGDAEVEDLERLRTLTVAWVKHDPDPQTLPTPTYRR